MAYYNRGNCYQVQKMYDEAIKDYDNAIELNEKSTPIYNNRGSCYFFQKKYNGAIKDFDKAIELDKKYAGAYCNRGNCYKAGFEDYNSAFEDYQCFIHLDDGVIISERLSTLLPFFRDYADAPMIIRQIIKKVPALEESIHFQSLIEDIYQKTEPFEQFFQHRQSEANEREFLFSQALAYGFMGDYGQPYSIYEALDTPEIPLNFAQNYYYAQSASIIGKIYGITPNEIYNDGISYLNAFTPTDFYYLALHHLQIGETEKALQIFEENEQYLPALYQQVIILNAENRKDEKLKIISKIKEIEANLLRNEGFLNDFKRKLHPNEKEYLPVFLDYAHYSEIEAALRIINPNHKTKAFYLAIEIDFNKLRKDLAKEREKSYLADVQQFFSTKQAIEPNLLQEEIEETHEYLIHEFEHILEKSKEISKEKLEIALAVFIRSWDLEERLKKSKMKISVAHYYDKVIQYFYAANKIDSLTYVVLHYYIYKTKRLIHQEYFGESSQEAILDESKEILKDAFVYFASAAGLAASFFAKLLISGGKNLIDTLQASAKGAGEDYRIFKAFFIENSIEEILKVKSDGFVNSESYKEISHFYEENRYLLAK